MCNKSFGRQWRCRDKYKRLKEFSISTFMAYGSSGVLDQSIAFRCGWQDKIHGDADMWQPFNQKGKQLN